MTAHLIVVANPEGKRWQTFRAEWERFRDDYHLPQTLKCHPWSDVLRNGLPIAPDALIRLESPGRDALVARQLLALGANDPTWLTMEMPKGWLAAPKLLHRGFECALRSLPAHPHSTADHADILTMFDKPSCAARLAAAGIPVPDAIEPPPTADALIEQLRQLRWPVAYIKLRTGSSATGMIALRPLHDPPTGTATMVQIGERFFNTRRLVTLQGEALRTAITYLIEQGACVQRGIPMMQIDGLNCDVRVIVIHGRIALTIFRLSPQPMTNLHLGGRRGESAHCRARIAKRCWLDALDHCCETASQFRADMVGIDLLFERDTNRYFVLEVNAFGDFFPGIVDEQGRSAHRLQMEAWRARYGWA